ncbi:hypothetical protein B0H21DRAFT_689082, partial [Amylocystis lapponica]
LRSEGTKYACGHYIIERKTGKVDCNNDRCTKSVRHRNPCPNCTCERYYGPDAKETITSVSKNFCPECSPWYKGR